VHVICTGRNAHPELVELADLVTEMKEVKHPYTKGILAQRGIDY
jgi:cob(I)alamin adenosyltransferase